MAYIGNKPAELAVDIDNASVTTEKLANDAVTAAKIVDGTIIADDLSTGIIVNSKVAANAAIAASKLAISGGSNITLQSDGTFDLDASVDVTGGYSVGGTAVISSSRAGTLTGLSLTGNITKASGDLTLDVAGDIVLNADGGDWLLNDGTVTLGSLQNDGNDNLIVMSNTNNKSIKFLGIDNSNTITALLLDMSEAGAATFNSDVDVSSGALKVGGTTVIDSSRNGSFGTVTASGGSTNNNDNANILTLNASEHARLLIDTSSTGGHRATLALESNGNETQLTTTGSASYLNVASGDLTLDGAEGIIFDTDNNQSVKLKLSGSHYASLYKSNDHFMVYNPISNGDIRLQGKDGSSVITALTLDMSEAGAATFNAGVTSQRLNVTAATGLSTLAVTTNAFTIGSTNDYNMAFDPNEIQARNNGAANDLILQKNGGSVSIGSSDDNPFNWGGSSNNVSISSAGNNDWAQLSLKGNGTGGTGINLGSGSVRHAGIFSLNGSTLAFATNPTNSGTTTSTAMTILSNGTLSLTAKTATTTSVANAAGGGLDANGGDIVTGRIFWTGASDSGGDLFGVNNESNGLTVYNYNDNRYQIYFHKDQHVIFGQASTNGVWNGTGSNSFIYANNGNGNGYLAMQNTTESNIYLSKHSSYSDERFLQFTISGSSKGTITANSSGTTYNTTSDRRLKTDIQPIEGATDTLMAMAPVTHKWKAHPSAPAVYGFIAQDMQALVPEAVSGDPDSDEMMSMDYGRITPVLVAALQDAHKKIEALEERLAEMEAM